MDQKNPKHFLCLCAAKVTPTANQSEIADINLLILSTQRVVLSLYYSFGICLMCIFSWIGSQSKTILLVIFI